MIVSAPAKINLTLEIVDVEPNGYHTLDTVFSWLELEDSLQVEVAEETSLTIFSEEIDLSSVVEDERNLVLRALRAVEDKVARPLPTRFQLTKRIPAGGGLGGGSADASAALLGINMVHELGLSPQDLLELARPLGADVAFGLVGGMARGRRYGDELESLSPLMPLLEQEMVLVFPPFACPTPQVYALWDQYPSRVARGASERFLKGGTLQAMVKEIANDLEEPAFRLRPQLQDYKREMLALGLLGVCLSGSGSTLFGFLPSDISLESVKAALSPWDLRILSSKMKGSSRLGLVS